MHSVLGTFEGHVLRHRESEADRVVAGARLQAIDHRVVRCAHRFVHCGVTNRVGNGRREDAVAITHDSHDVGFVDGAAHTNEVTECLTNFGRVTTQPGGDLRRLKAAGIGNPLRQREVMERHHGHETAGDAGLEDSAIVIQRGLRKLTFGWFNASPLD